MPEVSAPSQLASPAARLICRVAIIGAGAGSVVSGTQLALLCRRAGFAVVLEDVFPSNLRRAADAIEKIDPAYAPVYANTIEEAVRTADIVLDTVPDELESKLEILSLLDRMAPPSAIFLTPSEHLSIADLASCTYRADQCFGLRLLSPLDAVPLHCVLSHPPAAPLANIERVRQFLRNLGAEVIVERDQQPLP